MKHTTTLMVVLVLFFLFSGFLYAGDPSAETSENLEYLHKGSQAISLYYGSGISLNYKYQLSEKKAWHFGIKIDGDLTHDKYEREEIINIPERNASLNERLDKNYRLETVLSTKYMIYLKTGTEIKPFFCLGPYMGIEWINFRRDNSHNGWISYDKYTYIYYSLGFEFAPGLEWFISPCISFSSMYYVNFMYTWHDMDNELNSNIVLKKYRKKEMTMNLLRIGLNVYLDAFKKSGNENRGDN